MMLFTRRFYANFKIIQNEFVGKPINYLEIGVFLGHTAEWMLSNVLTHPDAKYYGIDPWQWFKPLHKRWPTIDIFNEKVIGRINNLRERYKCKAEFIQGFSQDVLLEPRWQKNSLDLIYVDGKHTIEAVLNDYVLSWRLLKVGGVIMFDDYLQKDSDQVHQAVDVIIRGLWTRKHGDHPQKHCKAEILWQNYAIGLRKLAE